MVLSGGRLLQQHMRRLMLLGRRWALGKQSSPGRVREAGGVRLPCDLHAVKLLFLGAWHFLAL